MKVGRVLNSMIRARLARVLFLVAAFLFLATIVAPGPPRPPAGPGRATLNVAAVALDEAQPGRRRVGALVYLRGWELSSDDPRFGALSAIHVANGEVTAVSDTGFVFEFALPRAAGREVLFIHPLPFAAGTPKRSRDTESLVVAGEQAWIGFESINAVKRFRRGRWREESAAQPAAMRRWRGNQGAEAMARLADGRFLVFAEGRDDDEPYSAALLFPRDPARAGTPAAVLRYRRPPGFRVTDVAQLPDGRLLILNRRFGWFSWFAASLVIADLPPPRDGATIAGRQIALLDAPLAVDNMEGLSVSREGGRTIVRIASDNDFMPLRQTLLLEFALIEGGAGR
jgi:hypothetical protein